MRGLAPLVLLALLAAGCVSTPPLAPPTAPSAAAAPLAETFRGNATLATIEPPPRVALHPTNRSGGEPSLGIAKDGTMFALAHEQTLRSRDGGATWEDVLNYTYPQPAESVFGTNDPYLHVDARTGRVFTDHMETLTCTNLLWSDDEGASWTRREEACGTPVVDFQKVFTAKPGPSAPPLAGVAYPDVVYLCYNKGQFAPMAGAYSTTCAVSYDGGLTFPIERQAAVEGFTPAGGFGGCSGGGTFAAAPDGTVVALMCGGYGLARSRDSGLTWDALPFPKDNATLGASVAFGAFGDDGALYMISVGEDGRAYLHRSRDAGDTWSAGFVVSPPGVAPVSFPTLAAGSAGRVAMAFLGARANATDPEKVDNATAWHVYVVTTDDALADAPAFRGVQATPPGDPAQVGPICLGGAACRSARNLGDFIGSARGPDGAFSVVFADGCVDACAAAPSAGLSRGALVTVATLRDWSLSPGSGTP